MSKSYGRLNIVMNPHPEGSYRDLFDMAAAAEQGVRFFGENCAAISRPSATENGIFVGRLAIWTEVDPDAPAINKRTFVQSILSDAGVVIPESIGINSRIFYFAFRLSDHRLYLELRNDEGQTVSISRARMAFQKIFEKLDFAEPTETIVHIDTQSNAVDTVLSIPRIRSVTIQLDLPNPDDMSEAEREIIEEMKKMNSKRIESKITKAAGEETLILSDRYRVMAEIAKDNVYVKAIGRDIADEKIERSTKDYPLTFEYPQTTDEPSSLAARRAAERL